VRCLNILNEVIERFGSVAINAIVMACEFMLYNVGAEEVRQCLRELTATVAPHLKQAPPELTE
jgi:hypothetical protein